MSDVLIVEDDALIALDVELTLQNLGMSTCVAGSVAAAKAALAQAPSVVLLDINVLDGATYGLAAELLARKIPFIFVSGQRQSDIPEELSHVPFLAKPCSPSALIQAIKTAIERPARSSNGPV